MPKGLFDTPMIGGSPAILCLVLSCCVGSSPPGATSATEEIQRISEEHRAATERHNKALKQLDDQRAEMRREAGFPSESDVKATFVHCKKLINDYKVALHHCVVREMRSMIPNSVERADIVADAIMGACRTVRERPIRGFVPYCLSTEAKANDAFSSYVRGVRSDVLTTIVKFRSMPAPVEPPKLPEREFKI